VNTKTTVQIAITAAKSKRIERHLIFRNSQVTVPDLRV